MREKRKRKTDKWETQVCHHCSHNQIGKEYTFHYGRQVREEHTAGYSKWTYHLLGSSTKFICKQCSRNNFQNKILLPFVALSIVIFLLFYFLLSAETIGTASRNYFVNDRKLIFLILLFLYISLIIYFLYIIESGFSLSNIIGFVPLSMGIVSFWIFGFSVESYPIINIGYNTMKFWAFFYAIVLLIFYYLFYESRDTISELLIIKKSKTTIYNRFGRKKIRFWTRDKYRQLQISSELTE